MIVSRSQTIFRCLFFFMGGRTTTPQNEQMRLRLFAGVTHQSPDQELYYISAAQEQVRSGLSTSDIEVPLDGRIDPSCGSEVRRSLSAIPADVRVVPGCHCFVTNASVGAYFGAYYVVPNNNFCWTNLISPNPVRQRCDDIPLTRRFLIFTLVTGLDVYPGMYST
jgi:hypothetical protein